MADNLDVAVMVKTNELAKRYGLKPYELVASFRPAAEDEGMAYVLRFEVLPDGSQKQIEQSERMLRSLGVESSDAFLTGSCEQIYDALERAIEVAPSSRRRQ